MPSILWRVCSIALLIALALAGVDWGLPTASSDVALFATHGVWDGKTLAGFDSDRTDAAVGADVDRNPVRRSTEPTPLNRTDAERAAIVRRYKLFSHQPDEMITFMALQQMNPAARQFDPRLYQYGGAWIYPVGGLLKAAGTLGLIDLRPDKAFYYDHPEAFGRFYVVARLYTLMAYAALMAAAGAIAWRLGEDEWLASATAAVVGAMPVTFAMAHEAKPHVAGTALVLFTALAAARWVRTARWRDALLVGVLAGLAAGMVLSAAVVVLVPLTMLVLPHPRFTIFTDGVGRRAGVLLAVVATAVLAYAVTNPYVILHAIHGDAVLKSNLANSRAMYGVGSAGALLAGGWARLLEAMSWPAVVPAAAGFGLAVTRRQAVRPLGILLTVPTIVVLGQFFAFAADKPAEYARFALLPAVVLSVLGTWALSTIGQAWLRRAALAAAPIVVLLIGTWPYVMAFAADVTPRNTRSAAAAAIAKLPPTTLQVVAEPAPYATPPMDVWAWSIQLVSPDAQPTAEVLVRAIDDASDLRLIPPGYRRTLFGVDGRIAPITWANKPLELLVRDGEKP